MVRHAWAQEVGGAGIVGVVMFFALSGYLITGVLTDQTERLGRVDFRSFYRNRAVRLLPALGLMLAVFAFVELVFDPLGDRHRLLLSVLMALTYTSDVPALVTQASLALGHLWTLAVEEQFYLVWPLGLMAWHRVRRPGPMLLGLLLTVYAVLVATVLSSRAPAEAYVLPSSWAIVLLLGAGARLYENRAASLLPARGRARSACSLIALAVLLAIAFGPQLKDWSATYLLLGPMIGVATLVVIFQLRDWKQVTTPWLRPLVWLGTVSYAAYLWDNVIVIWLGHGMHLTWVESLGSITLTLLAAQVSMVLVERPARRWKSGPQEAGAAGFGSPIPDDHEEQPKLARAARSQG
jgi:peptidoglycan/LPS O-acetylase OafA/YrhL